MLVLFSPFVFSLNSSNISSRCCYCRNFEIPCDSLADIKNEDSDVSSQIPIRIQDFISLIFDVEVMKSIMATMNIDLNKLPLGKVLLLFILLSRC